MSGFPHAIRQVGEVATFGASKYTSHGWREVPDAVVRYQDAMYRHLLAFEKREQADEESGLSHLAHAAWNLLAMMELLK